MSEGIVRDKSKKFALRVVRLYSHLNNTKREFVISKQLLRCGTSVGANIREAEHAMSKREFIAKMNISLKEAAESEYWLELLHESGYISKNEFKSLISDCGEVKGLLISIIKTANNNLIK